MKFTRRSSLDDLRPFYLSLAKRADEMTRAEAQGQFMELMGGIPEFLSTFKEVLAKDDVQLNGASPEMLDRAGEWLVSRAKLQGPDLSVPTMSACCYLGLNFAERLLADVPEAKWELITDDKRNIYYQQPCVISYHTVQELEPMNVAMNFVRGRVRGSREGGLSVLYFIWKDVLGGVRACE